SGPGMAISASEARANASIVVALSPRACPRGRGPPGGPGCGWPPLGWRAMDIEGNGALVVGGASGLGEATARRLHAQGAALTIADVNAKKGQALADELG